MTPEDITLLTKLQVVFKERMGNERNGDMFWSKRYNCISYVVEGSFSVDSDVSMDEEDIIVPLAIDPINPERGLTEMCKHISAKRPVYDIPTGEIIAWDIQIEPGDGNIYVHRAKNEYTALLKALCEQENIK